MALTKAQIERLKYDPRGKQQQVTFDKGGVPGLGVSVRPSGVKTFVLMYRPKGSYAPRRFTLGRYGVLTLDQAREAARKALHDARHGTDPIVRKNEEKRGERVRDLAMSYLKREAKRLKTFSEIERRINKHILPRLGSKRVKDVSTADITKLHHDIADGSGPVEANRVRTLTHRLFECARKWGFTEKTHFNPVADVEPFKERSRERFASEEELPHLWRAIEAEPDVEVRVAFRLILLTGCRKNEVLGLTWRNVSLTKAELRLPNPKSGKPEIVALSPQAVDLLRELPRGFGETALFRVATVKRAWARIRARLWLYMNPDEAAQLEKKARRDLEKRSKHVSRKAPAFEKRLLAMAAERAKQDDWLTIHDLRRSAGSLMALHEAPTTVGAALRNPSAVAIYTRISADEARRALNDHGKRLLALVKEAK